LIEYEISNNEMTLKMPVVGIFLKSVLKNYKTNVKWQETKKNKQKEPND